MSYSFEYIDIILLAMIAGFIFLRLRGILGKKSGFEEDINQSFPHEAPIVKTDVKLNADTFDENAKKEFLKGAQIAYETIVTSFSEGKLKDIKSLLGKEVYDQFDQAVNDRQSKNLSSNTTFIGINSAEIKEHEKTGNILNVTVDFIAEVITCIRDKEKKIVSGDPEKIKKIYDTWVFSRDTTSVNPNWQLVNTLT